MADLVLSLATLGLWLVVLVSDLRQRRVAIPVLLALLIVSLLERLWPWWLSAFALILIPRRWIITLASLGLGAGLFLNDLTPGLAMAFGSWAWAMRWWAGADAIVFVALTLRAGEQGLVMGLVAVLATALVVFLKRRQSSATLLLALNEVVRLQPRTDQEIPKETELPAAAVLAVAGIMIEVMRLVAS